jgi:NAD(P)-dependent dehydrogenase (short-subunit alcohol dehydrogenase family)
VRALGRRAEVRHLDLQQLPDAADVVDELADALGGRLWALVSNAGGGSGGPFLDLSYDEWRSSLRLNLDGAFLCLQRAARRMVAAGAVAGWSPSPACTRPPRGWPWRRTCRPSTASAGW